jgi:hypothetical protein
MSRDTRRSTVVRRKVGGSSRGHWRFRRIKVLLGVTFLGVSLCIALAAAAGLVLNVWGHWKNEKKRSNLEAARHVQVEKWAFAKEPTTMMRADFTLRNFNDFDIADVVVRCTHSSGTGVVLASDTKSITVVIPANSSRSVFDVRLGYLPPQVVQTICTVESASVAEVKGIGRGDAKTFQ